MTLYHGQKPRGARLDGPERALDGFIGLIILVVEVLVGLLVIFALSDFYDVAEATGAASVDNLMAGFGIAFFVSSIVFVITTIIYLVRLAVAKRSWPAPLWGLILVSASCTIGYVIMTAS